MKQGFLVFSISLWLVSGVVAKPTRSVYGASGLVITSGDKPYPLRWQSAQRPQNGEQDKNCLNVNRRLTVCKEWGGPGERITFVIRRDNKLLGQWPSSSFRGVDTFEVFTGDLDKDGVSELIVANLENAGNGLGVDRWKIVIFRDVAASDWGEPLSFVSEEFGGRGSFVKHAGDPLCQLLVTDWQYLTLPGQKPGMYLVGRWFHYRRGQLTPVPQRPVVLRRLRNGFAELFGRTQRNPEVPLRWFKHGQTESLLCEPVAVAGTLRRTSATIQDHQFTDQDGLYEEVVSLRWANGQRKKFSLSAMTGTRDDEFYGFCHLASGRCFPNYYQPASGARYFSRRRVWVAEHPVLRQNSITRTLWLK